MQSTFNFSLQSDYEMIDYLNELREGCLEAYTGIIQGLKGDSTTPNNADLMLVLPHVSHMVRFISDIGQDNEKSDSCIAASAGLIG